MSEIFWNAGVFSCDDVRFLTSSHLLYGDGPWNAAYSIPFAMAKPKLHTKIRNTDFCIYIEVKLTSYGKSKPK